MSDQLESGTLQAARSLSNRANVKGLVSPPFSKNNTHDGSVPVTGSISSILHGNSAFAGVSTLSFRCQIVTGTAARPSHLRPWFMKKGTKVPFKETFVPFRNGLVNGSFAAQAWMVDSFNSLHAQPELCEEKTKPPSPSRSRAVPRSRPRQSVEELLSNADFGIFASLVIGSKSRFGTKGKKVARRSPSQRRARMSINTSTWKKVPHSGVAEVEVVWSDDWSTVQPVLAIAGTRCAIHQLFTCPCNGPSISVPPVSFKRSRDSTVADIEPNPGPPYNHGRFWVLDLDKDEVTRRYGAPQDQQLAVWFDRLMAAEQALSTSETEITRLNSLIAEGVKPDYEIRSSESLKSLIRSEFYKLDWVTLGDLLSLFEIHFKEFESANADILAANTALNEQLTMLRRQLEEFQDSASGDPIPDTIVDEIDDGFPQSDVFESPVHETLVDEICGIGWRERAEGLQAEILRMGRRIHDAESRADKADKARDELKANRDKHSRLHHELQDKFDRATKRVSEAEEEIKVLESDNRDMAETLKNARQRESDLASELTTAKSELDTWMSKSLIDPSTCDSANARDSAGLGSLLEDDVLASEWQTWLELTRVLVMNYNDLRVAKATAENEFRKEVLKVTQELADMSDHAVELDRLLNDSKSTTSKLEESLSKLTVLRDSLTGENADLNESLKSRDEVIHGLEARIESLTRGTDRSEENMPPASGKDKHGELASLRHELALVVAERDQLQKLLLDESEMRKRCNHHKFANEFTLLPEICLDEFMNITQNRPDLLRILEGLIEPIEYDPPYFYDTIANLDENLELNFSRWRSPREIIIGKRIHCCDEPPAGQTEHAFKKGHDEADFENDPTRNPGENARGVTTRLRHEKQDDDLRSLSHPGLHGVNFDLRLRPRSLPVHTLDFLASVDYSHVGPRKVAVTASRKWSNDKVNGSYVIDLRPTSGANRVSLNDPIKDSMIIYLSEVSGKALQLLRFEPLFHLHPDSDPIVLNGGTYGWQDYFERRVNWPTPQAYLGYVFPSYAGACRISRRDMEKQRDTWYKCFQYWSGVYGVDENVLTRYENFMFLHDVESTRNVSTHPGTDIPCHAHIIDGETEKVIFTMHWFSASMTARMATTNFGVGLGWEHAKVKMPLHTDYSADLEPSMLFGKLKRRRIPYKHLPTLAILDDGGKTLLVNAYDSFVTSTHSKEVVYFGHADLTPKMIDYLLTRDVVLVVADHWLDGMDKSKLLVKYQNPILAARRVKYHKCLNKSSRTAIPADEFFNDCISFANNHLDNKIKRDPWREVSEANPGSFKVTGRDEFPLGYAHDSRFRVTVVEGIEMAKARPVPKRVLQAMSRVWANPDTMYAELPEYFYPDRSEEGITWFGEMTVVSRLMLMITLLRKNVVYILILFASFPIARAAVANANDTLLVVESTHRTVRDVALIASNHARSANYFTGQWLNAVLAALNVVRKVFSLFVSPLTLWLYVNLGLALFASFLKDIAISTALWFLLISTLFVGWYNLWGYKYQGLVPVSLPKHNPLYSASAGPTPETDEDLSDALLIGTLGTRGDHIPMNYFGRLAALMGVRTHMYRVHEGTNETLMQLRRANFEGLRSSYMQLFTTGILPYKVVLQPFVDLGGNVDSYSLSPSGAYVRPLNFGGNPTLFSKIASFAHQFFQPTMRVGSLKECALPRSPDGFKLLRKLPRSNRTKEGYTHGSEDSSVIPAGVRARCDELKAGDHQITMREFGSIYSHAGAGTIQTMLMTGLTVRREHICDRNIDRWYHTIPSRDDVMERSPYVFLGYLITRGFKLDELPIHHKFIAVGIWACATFGTGSIAWCVSQAYRIYAVMLAFQSLLHTVFLVALTFPMATRILGVKWFKRFLITLTWILIQAPLLTQLPWIFTLAYWLNHVLKVGPRVIREVTNWFDTRTVLVMTSNEQFPAPFGHWYFLCKTTGKRYEGQFVGDKGWCQQFAWVSKTSLVNHTKYEDRGYYQTAYMFVTGILFIACSALLIGCTHPLIGALLLLTDAFIFVFVLMEPVHELLSGRSAKKIRKEITIPLPFTSNTMERLVAKWEKDQKAGLYHPFYTCQSLGLEVVLSNSLIVSGFCILIFLFSLTVLVPGWLSQALVPVCRLRGWSIFGMPIADILDDIQSRTNFAAAAGPSRSTETNEDESGPLVDPADIPLPDADENLEDEEPIEEVIAVAEEQPSKNAKSFDKRLEYYRSCGIPEDQLPRTVKGEQELIDLWTRRFEEPLEVFEQIQTLFNLAIDESDPHSLTLAEASHVRAMTVANYLENHRTPEEIRLENSLEPGEGAVETYHDEMPASQNDPTSANANRWAKFLGKLDDFLAVWSGDKFVADVISWLRNQRLKHVGDMAFRIYHVLCFIGNVVYTSSFQAWRALNLAMACFVTAIFPMEEAKRLKSAWAFASLSQTPFLSTKRKFQENIAWSSKEKRGDFIESFTSMVDEINHYCKKHGAPGVELHPQYRRVNIGKPVLDDEQASLLGLDSDAYVKDERNDKFVAGLRERGAPVSTDTVYLTEKIEYVQQSVRRYIPRYEPICGEDKWLASEIAQSFGNRWEETFKDAKTLTPRQVKAYVKMKYAPGSPWISIYKTRQALEDAGITEALFEMVEDRLYSGKYPDMYHKAFVKSQVVSLEKVMLGNKNVRTVVAEELLTYFMNQCMELERNHRHNWKVTGTGIGMPMNQSMIHLYNELMRSRKEHGGIYAIADAHEYDSRKSPFAFETLGRLAEIGYEGKPQASVLRAKYDALQSSWIFQETMPNHHNSASVIVPSKEIANQLMSSHPGKFITASLVHNAFPRVSQVDLYNADHPVHTLYANKVVLATSEDELTFADKSGRMRYRLLSPLFVQAFLTDPPRDLKVPFQKFDNVWKLKEWLTGSVAENIDLCYNVAQKNRGGGTGENATSWDNSWGFKSAFVATWIKYMSHFGHNYGPEDFFRLGNIIYNTGDDSAIKLTLDKNQFDRRLFMTCAEHYGLELDFDLTGDIKDVEYLGNAIRRPNTDDKRKLEAWQKMTTNIQRSRKEEVQPPKLPRFLVYHKERDAYIRLSSRRYYQNQAGGLSFVHANIAKYSGMATIAIFNPELWNLLANSYCEDAERLAKYYNVPGFTATIKKDQFGMDHIVLKDSSNAKRGAALRAHIKSNPGYRLSKQEQFFVFMSGSLFPSQSKSIRDALDIKVQLPVIAQQLSFIQKLDRKSGNLLEATNLVIDYISESLGNLPRYMYKMQANILPATGEPAFATANYPVEHFIAKCQEPESEGFLLGKLARSPWASVTNGQDFYRHYQDVEFRENHDKYTKEDYANRLILALGLYAGFYAAENYLVRIPIFGFLIRIFYMILIDTPKVYGIVSCLYWHYYGDNSPIISALMPKDIFIWGKRFAMFIASNLPMWLVSIPLSPFFYLYYLLSFVVLPIETLCQLIVSNKQNSEHPGSKETAAPFDNPWDREVRTEEGRFQVAMRQRTDLVLPPTHAGAEPQVIRDVPRPFVIKSAVGSGKSSLLPYALLNNARWIEDFTRLNCPDGGRIVLSLPRTILRDKWSSPLENDRQPVKRLKKGVDIDRRDKILIGTDGHLLNRVIAGELTDKDVYLLDEFHELNGQKVALLEELAKRKCRVMLPSATPKPVPGMDVGVVEAGIPRRFAPDIWPISDSISPADALRQFGGNFVTQWPISGPPDEEAFKERVLIKCTHINGRNGVNETLEILQYDQWNCYALTSETARDPIPSYAQVVIATDVINTGISLPGFKLLVYDGKMHAVDQGEHSVTWVDPDTKHQGMARVGRYGPGDAVLCPISAGTGPTPQVYPAMTYLHWGMNAQTHDLPQLCDYTGYASSTLRERYSTTKLTPYLCVSNNLSSNVRDAVSMYHAIANSGCRSNEIRMVYTKLISGKPVAESYELIERFAADKTRTPVPYEAVVMAMAQEPVIYLCRNLTEKTTVPVATTLDMSLQPTEPALYDAYCARTSGPLVPYRGRLRPLEETESKIKNGFVIDKETKPIELYNEVIQLYESEAKEARDALEETIKIVADIRLKQSKSDPVTQVKNTVRKILATKLNSLSRTQLTTKPKASRLKINLTENTSLSPTLTYTTIDNRQYIHNHKQTCPMCDETIEHQHVGYNGAKDEAFDMRDEWFDNLIESEDFIFFHHGESVTNSQPEDQPKKIGDRKGKGRAQFSAPSTLNPSAMAFIPPRLV
jgi:hypothetical protein